MVADTLEVLAYPDPTLRQVCEDCDPADKGLRKLARRMAKTMYADNGCGLAAPQVGVLKRLIVIDCDQDSGAKNPITLLNPTVIETRGPEVVEEEGCLSVPGITVPIRRPTYAIVRYTDLNGITLFESCDLNERIKAMTAYEAALAAGAKAGDTAVPSI